MVQVQVYFSRASLYLQIKKILAACVVRDSSVENEAYLDMSKNGRVYVLFLTCSMKVSFM
jgi:hypothetical protein